MTTAKDCTRRAATVTPVFIGPIDNPGVVSAIFLFFRLDGKLLRPHLLAFDIVARLPEIVIGRVLSDRHNFDDFLTFSTHIQLTQVLSAAAGTD